MTMAISILMPILYILMIISFLFILINQIIDIKVKKQIIKNNELISENLIEIRKDITETKKGEIKPFKKED